jgi:hypothetical protein
MPNVNATSGSPVTKRRPDAPAAPEHVLLTVSQVEERHPALKGRLRAWVHRADCGDPDFALLRVAIVRVGRSVFLSQSFFAAFIDQHRGIGLPAPPRNKRLGVRPKLSCK